MRSFFLDSNALIYWLHPDSPMHDDVSSFLHEAFRRDCGVYVLSSTLNEVYYALHSHYMNEKQARAAIATVADVCDLVDLTTPLVRASLDSDEPDYEDGLVRATAEALQVDAIVSYDKRAFKHSFIPRLTASEATDLLREG